MPSERLHSPLAQLVDVYLQDISFRRNDAFELARLDTDPPPYSVEARIETALRDGREMATADLHARIVFHDEQSRSPIPFDMELVVRGVFYWDQPDLPDEEIEGWLAFNGVTLLWPYLRSFVSQTTNAAGLPPLVLYTLGVPRPRLGETAESAAEAG